MAFRLFVSGSVPTRQHRAAVWSKMRAYRCSLERVCPKTNHEEEHMSGFNYKEQYAVVVLYKDEKEQEAVYNRLKEEGHKLKVVAV